MNRSLARALLRARLRIDADEASRRIRAARRILLVKPHHKLGDLMVATPFIRNLRLALPEAELVFVAGPQNAGAVLDSPDLDRVHVARPRGPLAGARALPLLSLLRRTRFDAALVLSTISQSSTAVAIARWSGAGWVGGLDDRLAGGGLAGTAYDFVAPAPADERLHIVEVNLALLEALGLPVRTREHVLGVTEAQRREGRGALAAAGVPDGRPVIGVQPGGTATRSQRHWPPSHYAALVQRARAETGWQPVLLGRPEDRPVVEEIQRLSRTPFPELLDLPFPAYKGVLAALDLFVTHDGGPAHLAAGAGVPSFIIYLVTPAWRWAPFGPHVHVWDDLNRPPSPSDAWERVRPLLAAPQPRGVGLPA